MLIAGERRGWLDGYKLAVLHLNSISYTLATSHAIAWLSSRFYADKIGLLLGSNFQYLAAPRRLGVKEITCE